MIAMFPNLRDLTSYDEPFLIYLLSYMSPVGTELRVSLTTRWEAVA